MRARVLVGSLGLFPDASILAVRAQAELISKGFADSRAEISASWECVLVAVEQGREFVPAGMISFAHDAPIGRMWLQLSYVVEEYRGRGVYKLMYNAVRTIAQQRKCRTIESATHIKNTAMRAIGKKLGRTEEFVIMVDELELEPENMTIE